MTETCELYKIIPIKELDRVFKGSASAELDHTFLCFEDIYKSLSAVIPKHWTILDIGCAYAAQAYYFTEHKKYIGVCPNIVGDEFIHFQTDNMEFYELTAQEYIPKYIETLDVERTFAICSYVPDKEAQSLVRECFPNCFVYYPKGKYEGSMEPF